MKTKRLFYILFYFFLFILLQLPPSYLLSLGSRNGFQALFIYFNTLGSYRWAMGMFHFMLVFVCFLIISLYFFFFLSANPFSLCANGSLWFWQKDFNFIMLCYSSSENPGYKSGRSWERSYFDRVVHAMTFRVGRPHALFVIFYFKLCV